MDALPERAAVVIVGGGLAGASTAWWLAQRGVTDVAVIEREDVLGLHASGRNAGICRQIAEDDRWTELCVRGARFLRNPPGGFASRALMDVTGSLMLGAGASTLGELSARAAAHGIAHRVVDAAEVAAMVPAAAGLECAGALHVRDDGVIDTSTLLAAFVRGARAAGVRFVVGAEVEALRDGEVVTSRGTVRAGTVAIAGGAWAGVLGAMAGSRDVDFAPIKRHLFFLAQDADGPEVGAPVVWRVGADECYVRNGADGLIASACDAARTAPGDVRVDPEARAWLAARFAPAAKLASRAVTATWACQRTFAPEGPPRIARDRDVPWLVWVAGLGGHGATAAAAIGEDAAAVLSSTTTGAAVPGAT